MGINNKIDINLKQIYAITVKEIKLATRFKSGVVAEFFVPLLSLFFPLIIFNALFSITNEAFSGYYSIENYILFLLLGYCVKCLIFIIWTFKDNFYREKQWLTIKSVMISPVNKFNILIGMLLSVLIIKFIPILVILILCYFFFPISIAYFLLVILVIFLISITFAGFGFIIGAFEVSNENIAAILSAIIPFIPFFSCLFYPLEIFPKITHPILLLNPLYYYFDLLRLLWWAGMDFQDASQYITINHFLIVGLFSVCVPIVSIVLFSKIYKKYGVVGY
ncbi:MAG: ABC transporter permease [Promethearchaeota archaeon]